MLVVILAIILFAFVIFGGFEVLRALGHLGWHTVTTWVCANDTLGHTDKQ